MSQRLLLCRIILLCAEHKKVPRSIWGTRIMSSRTAQHVDLCPQTLRQSGGGTSTNSTSKPRIRCGGAFISQKSLTTCHAPYLSRGLDRVSLPRRAPSSSFANTETFDGRRGVTNPNPLTWLRAPRRERGGPSQGHGREAQRRYRNGTASPPHARVGLCVATAVSMRRSWVVRSCSL